MVDPPGRVARLSLMDGEVSLAPAGTEEWADGVLNRPITSGDRVWVGTDGRAELQIGTASVHLDRSTGFRIHRARRRRHADEPDRRRGDDARAHARRPRERSRSRRRTRTVHFRHPGDYTVQVDPATDRTIVRTRNGEAEVTGANKSFRVRADEEGAFTGLDGLTANIGSAPAADRIRIVGERSRPPRRHVRVGALRFARSRRLRRPRRRRRLDRRARIRPRVAAAVRRARLGAVSLRPLGLGRAVGLDLDRRRALGLRALPLRPLGVRASSLVLGAGSATHPSVLRAGARRLGRRAVRERVPVVRQRRRLVPARAARSVRAVVPAHAALRAPRERVEHDHREQHQRHERVRPTR